MTTGKKLEDLDLSRDEISRLTKALKNEEFRNLLADYAQEISDPENRAKYEEEITMLENERGMDVKFVNPEPGHVIKASFKKENLKAFFNICKNDNIEEAKCSRKKSGDGKSGLAWSLPHSFSPVRDDFDKKGNKCKVFDFVVHSNTYRMAESNERFMKMLHDTAIESAEKQFGVQLDRQIHRPKMKFKGTPTATVIRNRKEDGKPVKKEGNGDFLDKVPYPYDDKTSEEKAKLKAEQIAKEKADREARKAKQQAANTDSGTDADGYKTPVYILKHRNNLDLQQFTNARDSRPSTRPTELLLEIELPSIKSASSVELDIFEKQVKLQSESPVKYRLDITLPYEVDENKGSAKFEKTKHKLIVTLPVIKQQITANANIDILETSEESVLNETSENEFNGASPLIEVLSSHETVKPDSVEADLNISNGDNVEKKADINHEISLENENGDDVETKVDINHATLLENDKSNSKSEPITPRIFYTFPSFDYLQNDETVTVILDVKNATRDSLVKNFMIHEGNCTGVSVKMVSIGPGGFPMHYCFHIKFESDNCIDEATSYVSLNNDNIVITLVKKDEYLGLWDKFKTGINEDNLEEKLFLTEHNVTAKLKQLDQELQGQESLSKEELLDLEVTDMNSKCLSVDIKEKRGDGHSFSDSAEEIKVVHNREGPKIHGILKQRSRTVSESSDDIVERQISRQQSTGGETSPTTVTEESENENSDSQSGGRKKSVSFSEHIDQTVYKTSQSVSSMRSTLKNKRKKARRKEQRNAVKEKRQEERRRRRSSNSLSEPSSDEYVNGSNANGDSVTDDNNKTSNDTNIDETLDDNSKEDLMDQENVTKQSESIDAVTSNNVTGDVNERTCDSDDGEDDVEGSSGGKDAADITNGGEENVEKPDTMLSWESNNTAKEYQSPCAFDFTNKLMYELDVD